MWLAKKAGYAAVAVVSHSNSNTDGPHVAELGFSFPNVAKAKQFVNATRAAVATCKAGWSYTIVPGNPPTNTEIELAQFPKVADEQFASHSVTTGGSDDILRDPDLPTIGEAAVVRVGNHVIIVSRFGISVVMDNAKQQLRTNVNDALAHLAKVTKAAKTST